MSTRQLIPSKSAAVTFPTFTPVCSGLLQRKCACGGTPGPSGECEACREKKLQRRPGNLPAPSSINHQPSTASQVPPIVHEVLRSSGQPLDLETRAFMEARFGHDFSKVRVHTDASAAMSAEAVDASAYAVQRHIVFGKGQYAPETALGRKLLAHELTHTIQQGGDLQPTSVSEFASVHGRAEKNAIEIADSVTTHNYRVPVVQRQAMKLARQYRGDADKSTAADHSGFGVGVTKTKEFFKKKKTAVTAQGIANATLVGSGTLTVSPAGSGVAISDKEFNLEMNNLGTSIQMAPGPGQNKMTFSSKFNGVSPAVSTKISVELPNKVTYSTENAIVSYEREGKKVEGTLNLELTIEFVGLRPIPLTQPSPERVPWYLLLLTFVEESPWVVVALAPVGL